MYNRIKKVAPKPVQVKAANIRQVAQVRFTDEIMERRDQLLASVEHNPSGQKKTIGLYQKALTQIIEELDPATYAELEEEARAMNSKPKGINIWRE